MRKLPWLMVITGTFLISIMVMQSSIAKAESAEYVALLNNLERVSRGSDALASLPDGRPWVLVVFKSCCATNVMAVRWAASLGEKYGSRIGLLGITVDNSRAIAGVAPWTKARNARFPILWDPTHETTRLMGVIGIPAVFLLDSGGREIYRSSWFSGHDTKEIEARLDTLIQQPLIPAGVN